MSKEKTESGYQIEYCHYRSAGCENCPLKPQCTKAQGDREIKVSRFLLRGLPKVSLEVWWLSLAHNLLKKASEDAKNRGAKRKLTA